MKTKKNKFPPYWWVITWIVITATTAVFHYLSFDKGVLHALIFGALFGLVSIVIIWYFDIRKKSGKRS